MKLKSKLHPDSLKLLEQCFEELKAKMIRNQEKYGYTNEWLTRNWEVECREHMMQHIQKGDPKDVAIYAMFMMYRGWSTVTKENKQLPTAEQVLDSRIGNMMTYRGILDAMEEHTCLHTKHLQARIAELENENRDLKSSHTIMQNKYTKMAKMYQNFDVEKLIAENEKLKSQVKSLEFNSEVVADGYLRLREALESIISLGDDAWGDDIEGLYNSSVRIAQEALKGVTNE